MELKGKDVELVQQILNATKRNDFSIRLNTVDGVIVVYSWKSPYEPTSVKNLYSYRYGFYYTNYRDLTGDDKAYVDLAVHAIKMLNQEKQIDDKTVEEIKDDSTESIKDNFFKDYTDDLAKTLHDKNADYGDSFSKGMKRYGMKYVSSRLFDKLNRIDELSGSSDQLVKGESLKDSVKDLAGYAVLLWKYLDESEED